VYDGPGIRAAVFFKGCPLNCVWCHNPEGISKEPELTVNGRISGYEISAGEIAAKIRKNAEFYLSSNGGVTLTGGEPFYQSGFLFALLDELKDFHRAVETSGYVSSDIFEKALDHTELIIMDIKHADSSVHEKITGAGNKLILENLNILKNSGRKFIIRVPLIPGLNDSGENLSATAKLIAGAENLVRAELLPYNKLTGAKYKTHGKIYNPPFDENKTPDANQKYFEKYNIESVVM
jgi:pyruvate formate lyase activating enzyme